MECLQRQEVPVASSSNVPNAPTTLPQVAPMYPLFLPMSMPDSVSMGYPEGYAHNADIGMGNQFQDPDYRMVDPIPTVIESNFHGIQRELTRALHELEKWKINEQWKERDITQVIPGLNELHLNDVQDIFDWIVDNLHLVTREVIQYTFTFLKKSAY